MNHDRIPRNSLRIITLAAAALTLLSCRSSRITLSDLLGTWSFRNTVSSDYSQFIAAEWLIIFNMDGTYNIPQLTNMAQPDFDCRDSLFRFVLHYPIYGTHLVVRFLWEGEVSADEELAGKIYFTSLAGDPRNVWKYTKEFEIGSFTARKLSE